MTRKLVLDVEGWMFESEDPLSDRERPALATGQRSSLRSKC